MLRDSRLLLFALALAALPAPLVAQSAAGRIVSEHIWMRIPVEREWLGRDAIVEIEASWRYIHGMTGEGLPRKLLVEVLWDGLESRSDPAAGIISIGLGSAAARSAPRAHLVHDAAREMALLGLAQMSRGGAVRTDLRFLGEAMAEILAHEAGHSARALAGAWPLTQMLDGMRPLTFADLADWAAQTRGRRDLRAAAPGITLLLTCFELYGRERTLKLFEGVRKGSLDAATAGVFRTRAAALEEVWLRKVRGYASGEDVTVTTSEDAPALRVSQGGRARRGNTLELLLEIEDRTKDLSPHSVFVLDEKSGRVAEGLPPRDGAGRFIRVEIPIEGDRPQGTYVFRTLAVDEAGNVRYWPGSYQVVP